MAAYAGGLVLYDRLFGPGDDPPAVSAVQSLTGGAAVLGERFGGVELTGTALELVGVYFIGQPAEDPKGGPEIAEPLTPAAPSARLRSSRCS